MTKTILASVTAVLCATAPLSTQASAGAAEIPLSGHISADMANRFHAALADGKPHVVRVTSSGGEDAPTLAIAADIARTRSSLVVEGICAGPCANYLFLAAARRRGARVAVLDITLLSETGGAARVDRVVVVSAPRDVQMHRVRQRRGMTDAEIATVLARQMQDAEKRRRADLVVRTGLSRHHAQRTLRRFIRQLRETP